jgi:hypothetical protein
LGIGGVLALVGLVLLIVFLAVGKIAMGPEALLFGLAFLALML